MTLKLYNTLTRKKETFRPLDKENVRMYVCGPTVYDYAHIGNARPVIVFDVLFRLLRHLYGEDHVTYARNITDVDDKINARATEEGIDIRELTEQTTKQFHEDVAALRCLPPTVEPRATDHIGDMIAMIEQLVGKGFAYEAEGHVLFEVAKMADYGKLSCRTLDEMEAGARVEVAPYKKDPMDFVLWKPSEEDLPGWESPWGRGRPGWHIECSAMSDKHLKTPFDIHGGGVDLVFPHHENEVAQSRCCFGTDKMASVWMHNGYLQVEGEKMSKSLGNFVTVHELLNGWKGYSWPGEALRFNMLRTQYRQPLDWTYDSLEQSHKVLWDWYGNTGGEEPSSNIPEPILGALCDDLNTPKAITEMHQLANKKQYGELLNTLNFLGFSGQRKSIKRFAEAVGTARGSSTVTGMSVNAKEIEELIATRNEARENKDFAEADRIRDELAEMGITLKDGPDGTTWEVAR